VECRQRPSSVQAGQWRWTYPKTQHNLTMGCKARQGGSISQFYVIDDTDLAGTITDLPAA